MSTASLIVIGSELTRGIIQDRHGQLVSRELTHIGVHMNEIVALPDDGSVSHVLSALKKNNDIIIVTGGLGPTGDDMTRNAIAESYGVPLVEDPSCMEFLKKRLGSRASGANLKQAYIPEGFSVMPNPNGTAPGFYGTDGNSLILALPGPPREMEPMFFSYALPVIRKALRLPESERDEYSSFITAEARLEELMEQCGPGLDWGTRFQDYKISVYVSGGDKGQRDKAVSSLMDEVGPFRLVPGCVDALDILIAKLEEKKLTISAAESCSGGLASERLTSRPGSSSFFLGGVVSYSPAVKMDILGVDRQIVKRYGVVSAECAMAMADGVRKVCRSDVAFSITGVAGPDMSEGKAVGTVYIGFSSKDRETESVLLDFSSWGRDSVRRKSIVSAFLLTSCYIDGYDIADIVKGWKNI